MRDVIWKWHWWERATSFMATSSVLNKFVKLFIIRNELLNHWSHHKSVQLYINHKYGWLFLNLWIGLHWRWPFSNYVSIQQDHHLLTRVLFYSWKSFNQVVVAADVVSFIIENDSGWICCATGNYEDDDSVMRRVVWDLNLNLTLETGNYFTDHREKLSKDSIWSGHSLVMIMISTPVLIWHSHIKSQDQSVAFWGKLNYFI